MTDKEEMRKKLANAHYAYEPGITQVFSIWGEAEYEALPSEPVKLLEVNKNTIATGIAALAFGPVPSRGYPFPSVIIEVTPEEFERIQKQELSLPHGWRLGELIPRAKRSR